MRFRSVVVIGPGRLGSVLTAALQRAGHRVVAAAGGSRRSRRRFEERFAGVRTSADPAAVVPDADLVVVTTPDDDIEPVVTALAAADVLRPHHRVVHLAGSRGLAPLRRAALAGAHVAACHPAQTVPSGAPDPDVLVGAAWAVTAPAAARDWAHDLVRDLGGRPHDVRDEDRVIYHAGLALGSNAVAAAVAVARRLLLAARIDAPADFLAPLVERSTTNVLEGGADALTGPVVRGDAGTVARHLEALAADVPELRESYRRLTAVVLDQVRPALSGEDAGALDDLLDDDLLDDDRLDDDRLDDDGG